MKKSKHPIDKVLEDLLSGKPMSRKKLHSSIDIVQDAVWFREDEISDCKCAILETQDIMESFQKELNLLSICLLSLQGRIQCL